MRAVLVIYLLLCCGQVLLLFRGQRNAPLPANDDSPHNVSTPPPTAKEGEKPQAKERGETPNEKFYHSKPLNETMNAILAHPHAGARFQNGSLGYIADPTALQKSVPLGLNYFDRISTLYSHYRKGSITEKVPLISEYVCGFGPGRSFEDDGGFKLLTEKIVVSEPVRDSPRILCSIYTYPMMRDLARLQALTWGCQCDGFLAFSTETIPELGMLDILHAGEESYTNMWQKVRSIWAYISDHYLEDYDWFHLGGDDLFLVVNNLRRFLKEVDGRKQDPKEPVFLGAWKKGGFRNFTFVAGAPGYTLNREALRQFAEKALPYCRSSEKVSHEDRLMSRCLYDLGILPGDTRDYESGEAQYHDCGPNHLYTFRAGESSSFHSKAAMEWQNLTHPSKRNEVVGPKHGLDAAAKYSIAFHDIYHPIYAARLHVLLFPETCPATSVLGRALRFYRIVP